MADTALGNRMDLPRPEVSDEDAAEILARHYDLEGRLSELGSQQDRNFRLDCEAGRFVLKICHAAYERVELEAQNAALHHLLSRSDAPRVPKPVPTKDGEEILTTEIGGKPYHVRLLTFIEGESLGKRDYLPPASIAALGALCADLAMALADFDHPGLHRTLQWDLRRAGPVALQLLSAITDGSARDRIAKTMVSAIRRIQPLAPNLRLQAVHHDVTDDNVVARRLDNGWLIPEAVIDFGDIIRGWRVGDLAVTCACILHHDAADPFDIVPAVQAYHARYPLDRTEVQALWPLIVARAVILVASSERQLSIEPENDYVRGNIGAEWRIFERATALPYDVMEAALLRAVDMPVEPAPLPAMGPLLPDLGPVSPVDLGVESPLFAAGNWLTADMDWRLLARAARQGTAAATRYGEYRLSRALPLSSAAPASFALHSDICLSAGQTLLAPFPGHIEQDGAHLRLVGQSVTLHIDGADCTVEPGTALETGAGFARVSGEDGMLGGLRLQLCRLRDLQPPLFVRAAEVEAWSAFCPSPSSLIGPDIDAPPPEDHALLARRQAHLAAPQKHYYDDPPQIERGWKEHLFDVRGRSYLDMVNNVAILGHGHPRLAEAASEQWLKLNTNSRFHYRAVADFSERLASLAPDGLDAVFLVNSGSEANDLAIRLARAHTGARNMLCLLEAYHGWSLASDAVSTSIADNPQALTTRPGWVHPLASPNSYRGLFRGADSAEAYLKEMRRHLEALEEKGEGLAGFIAEAVYGNAGGLVLPQGYLAGVYEAVRARGGLCIADEVQVGYGRLGTYFWGFEEQGVVPDIITIAKGMGNGHPLGAVITTREIAASLEREGYFFSSAGGSPVSAVVGLTVLDCLEEERLQENARAVGEHLKARLEALAERHPLIGAVHGLGLYLGLELVRDRESLTPAREETAAICTRLLQKGVIMQPTGDHLNILKIKPPLCLTQESADFFVDQLDAVLEAGW